MPHSSKYSRRVAPIDVPRGQERRDVEADAAGADDGDARARRLRARQQVRITDDLRMIDAGDVRHARRDAARDHELVEVFPREQRARSATVLSSSSTPVSSMRRAK